MPAALERLINRRDPDPKPDIGYTNPNQQPEPNPDCTCPALDLGGNPTCALHGWWNRDAAVLDLADLTRELGSSWEAAKATFGGNA